MSKIQEQSINAKLHLACLNPKRKDAMLVNPALKYVFFDDGMAIAANGTIIIGYDLEIDLDQDMIPHLNGHLMLASDFKKIFGKTIKKVYYDNELVPNKIQMDSETYDIYPNGGDLKYPDYKKALPWENGALTHSLTNSCFDMDQMSLINECLNPYCEKFPVITWYYTEKHIIKIQPGHKSWGRTFALLMPISHLLK